MILEEILHAKGTKVFTISAEARLDEVAHSLVEHRIGALVVTKPGSAGEEELLGIVTERDILYHCARSNQPLSTVKVADVISSPLITGLPTDTIEQVMGLMTDKRIRHLPVLSAGRLAGIVSLGDIVKFQHDHLALENRFMKEYINR
jgi:CBS domain-containing protein